MKRISLTIAAAAVMLSARAVDFEVPPQEPASASLPATLSSGTDFHVREPVESDGLMRHYIIESKFGEFTAYGPEALKNRAREMAALTQISKTTDIDVVTHLVVERVQNDAKTVGKVVTNPVGTVTGIPRGIGHLFGGYKAQTQEFVDKANRSGTAKSGDTKTSDVVKSAKSNASKYASRYLGISAAERTFYQQLGVDPYTDNAVLHKAVHHLAQVRAAANLGLHFVGIPGIPYLGDVQRAMTAIYTEDPAVLRARQRKVLAGYGLSQAEVGQFENTVLLSPTRQALLVENAKLLDGVAGRDELFRHAMSLTSEVEVGVFIESTRLLTRLHAKQQPIARILPGLRLPTGETKDGRIIVVGAFDAVYWTEQVSGYEAILHAALPGDAKGLELWLTGTPSRNAREELVAKGWAIHDHAWSTLGEAT